MNEFMGERINPIVKTYRQHQSPRAIMDQSRILSIKIPLGKHDIVEESFHVAYFQNILQRHTPILQIISEI